MAIHPLALQRHPVRPEIPFFKNMRADTQGFGMLDGRSMNRSPVAEQNLVGNPVPAIESVQKIAQILRSTTKISRFPAAPVGQVASGEIDLEHLMIVGQQAIGQAREKRRANALQKEETTLVHR